MSAAIKQGSLLSKFYLKNICIAFSISDYTINPILKRKKDLDDTNNVNSKDLSNAKPSSQGVVMMTIDNLPEEGGWGVGDPELFQGSRVN